MGAGPERRSDARPPDRLPRTVAVRERPGGQLHAREHRSSARDGRVQGYARVRVLAVPEPIQGAQLMNKHTPGPWTVFPTTELMDDRGTEGVNGYNVEGPEGQQVVGYEGIKGWPHTAEADAHLI